MNRILILISFVILNNSNVISQNKSDCLYGYEYERFPIGDEIEYNCIIDKFVQSDTLYIEIFTQLKVLSLGTGWINLENDTVDIHIGTDGMDGGEHIEYDQETGEYKTYRTILFPFTITRRYGFLFKFKTLKEFLNKPVRLNGILLNNCNDRFSFELIGGDTVNLRDKYGMRQGKWLGYNENGTLTFMDLYNNDVNTLRYTFNKRGKTTSKWVYEYSVIGNPTMPTRKRKYFKELTKAPKKYSKK